MNNQVLHKKEITKQDNQKVRELKIEYNKTTDQKKRKYLRSKIWYNELSKEEKIIQNQKINLTLRKKKIPIIKNEIFKCNECESIFRKEEIEEDISLIHKPSCYNCDNGELELENE